MMSNPLLTINNTEVGLKPSPYVSISTSTSEMPSSICDGATISTAMGVSWTSTIPSGIYGGSCNGVKLSRVNNPYLSDVVIELAIGNASYRKAFTSEAIKHFGVEGVVAQVLQPLLHIIVSDVKRQTKELKNDLPS